MNIYLKNLKLFYPKKNFSKNIQLFLIIIYNNLRIFKKKNMKYNIKIIINRKKLKTEKKCKNSNNNR